MDDCLPTVVSIAFHNLFDWGKYLFARFFEAPRVFGDKRIDVRVAELVHYYGQGGFTEQRGVLFVAAPGSEDAVDVTFFSDSYSRGIAIGAVEHGHSQMEDISWALAEKSVKPFEMGVLGHHFGESFGGAVI